MSPTVVITGASAGIGRATAHRFARAGARLGLIARDRGALDDVKDEVEALGGTAAVAAVDVADAAAVTAAMGEFALALGPIDIWINNAMVTVFSPVEDMTPEEFKRVTEVTYLGCVHGTWAALQHMRPHDRGLVIQVGSALAYRGIPLQSAYCGAKFAIRGFTDALRSELIHQKSRIKLMMIQLPAVNTPQFDWARTHMPRAPRPVPPVLQPEVIAEAIYKASLKPKREYWIARSTLEVIFANMALPGFFDRLLSYKAYTGQMTRWPARSWRRDNLEAPIHALHRTHGSFDREAGREALLIGGEVARVGSGLATMAMAYCAFVLARRVLLPRSRRARRLK
ncbi:SDR family oxidoreductase [Rhodoplanes sp. Z2-YC6860]|uniref:SDR family oxidoreductase n=1 Tax=Rhodoplanes sp. Z2-YC6860 TaxID=674703 RepID=UPI00078B3F71|nr:SDR family oxidoreductase [Rhodoplanes sp. Z2-YC6860]AMN43105.1 short chain dehydrogenase [Rhodoplanes sp. Z2-YC6860]